MKETPCHRCTERSATCHANCPAYAEYRAMMDAERERRFKEHEAIRATCDSIRHAQKRIRTQAQRAYNRREK